MVKEGCLQVKKLETNRNPGFLQQVTLGFVLAKDGLGGQRGLDGVHVLVLQFVK